MTTVGAEVTPQQDASKISNSTNTPAVAESSDLVTVKQRLKEKFSKRKIESDLKPAPTKHVRIDNFQRPLNVRGLVTWLSNLCQLQISENAVWLNSIKSYCYVDFDSIEEAEKCMEKISGARFPVTNPLILIVNYTNVSAKDATSHHPEALMKLDQWLNYCEANSTKRKLESISFNFNDDMSGSKLFKKATIALNKFADTSGTKVSHKPPMDFDNFKPEPLTMTGIDIQSDRSLYKKTEALPCLYWSAANDLIVESNKKNHTIK